MLCDNMGAEMADTCKQYVDIYAPAVFAMAMGYLVPGPVCQSMKLCPAPPPPTRTSPKPFLPGATWALGIERLQQRGEVGGVGVSRAMRKAHLLHIVACMRNLRAVTPRKEHGTRALSACLHQVLGAPFDVSDY